MDYELSELLAFLKMSFKPEVQQVTLQYLLDFTGDPEALKMLCIFDKLIEYLIILLQQPPFAVTTSQILINISAEQIGAEHILSLGAIEYIKKEIYNPESSIADACCMILSNITRLNHITDSLLFNDTKELVNVLTKVDYNKKNQNLYYLGSILANLSQYIFVREQILNKNDPLINQLLPFVKYKDSVIKRFGIISTLYNCCFETKFHSWLLSEAVDILPHLLLPLAGNTEYEEEDNDKLPIELQYLPSDKEREEDPKLRCMLLKIVTKLCSMRVNREFIRDKNTYIILRELHKWEMDVKCRLLCEHLVNILIRTEVEIGADNLNDIAIPEYLQVEFDQLHDYD